jgi:hypothetical protein
MNELDTTPAPAAGGQLVPVGFAEKAMASLMQLHTELVEEKEKRVALYRTLMEKEQSLAELAMYVRVLEERLGVAAPAVPEVPKQHVAQRRPAPEPAEAPRPAPPQPASRPAPAPVAASEGWKVW